VNLLLIVQLTEQDINAIQELGYKQRDFPASQYLATSLPMRYSLMYIPIAVIRVYGKAHRVLP
jgi:hypothetical protein